MGRGELTCGALILVDKHRRECEDISADTLPNACMHDSMRASAREQEVRVLSAVSKDDRRVALAELCVHTATSTTASNIGIVISAYIIHSGSSSSSGWR